MRLVIFGASGKVGRLAVTEALDRHHEVLAFVHSNNRFESHANLTVLQGDIHNAKDVARAVQGCQAVISALGSWGTKDKNIVSSAMVTIIPAMEQAGIERIVSLTGAEARNSADKPDLLSRTSHFLASLAARKILSDAEEHLRLLRASNLEWTVLRSPVMTSSADIFYKLSMLPQRPWRTIPRRAVAKALLDQLDGPAYARAAPFLYRR